MTPPQLIADVVARNAEMVKMTLADFSEGDLLVRPVPTANHTAWQLCHMIGAVPFMIGPMASAIFAPAATRIGEKGDPKCCTVNDPNFFPKKAELIEVFSQVTTTLANWIQTLAPDDLEKPTVGPMAQFAPTLGHLLLMSASHNMMHLGQMQVIRRALGKPILF